MGGCFSYSEEEDYPRSKPTTERDILERYIRGYLLKKGVEICTNMNIEEIVNDLLEANPDILHALRSGNTLWTLTVVQYVDKNFIEKCYIVS